MGWFDRFRSSKGKAKPKQPKGKARSAEDAKQEAFANVPASQTETTPAKKTTPSLKSDSPQTPKPTKDATWEAYRLLLRPIVTEKSNLQAGQYSFDVPLSASKTDIQNAIHHAYGIRPINVNISHVTGKSIRYGRYSGRTRNRKKAIVTLPSGKTIDIVNA